MYRLYSGPMHTISSQPCTNRDPAPNTLSYNDWRQLPVASKQSFSPSEPVTVVVPCFEAPAALAALLAGLERQTYPRELFEIVVVDDGSATPLRRPSSPLEVRVIHREERGFGLARARNNGARAASHDILVFLDGDMIPGAGLLAAHARWHHVVADAVTLGFRAAGPDRPDIETIRGHAGSLRELYGAREFDAWRTPLLVRSGDLTSRHDWPFRTMVGANFAMRRAFYLSVGGSDESFTRYGGEDTELAYRAYAQGAVLVPVRDALAWHGVSDREEQSRKQQALRPRLANLIPHPACRRADATRIWAVPRHVVTIRSERESVFAVAAAVENVLADPAADLVVRIEAARMPQEDLVWLEEYFVADTRVRIAPLRAALEEFPTAAFHIELPIEATAGRGVLACLREHLGTAVQARATLPGGRTATIARVWALHRAKRTGRTAGDFGAVVSVPAPKGRRWRGVLGSRPRKLRPGIVASAVRALAAEARHIRGPRTAKAFLYWLTVVIRRRWSRTGTVAPQASAAPPPMTQDCAFGAEIAVLGQRAAAVFASSAGVRDYAAGQCVDVVLADTQARVAGGVPVVVLAERPRLAVPAFDPAIHNPIGWRRTVEDRMATLGPTHLLPAGPMRVREVSAHDSGRLRASHHLMDVAAFHSGPAGRAGLLVRLAATGLPVRVVDCDAHLAACLGPELQALMSEELAPSDADARESLSVRMRRVALRDHSLHSRARQVCEAGLVDPPTLPKVSILMATMRPALLRWAIANLARQNYPNLELVLALHGEGFGDIGAALAELRCPVKVLRLDRSRCLGSVLNAAADAAGGVLLTKMDDDDLYGSDHLWDLVLAHRYSRAHLVGKGIEHVYLCDQDRTVKLQAGRAETYSHILAGGTLLIARHDLARFGGWPRVPRGVDTLLIRTILGAGGRVYRTHGAGYKMIRHGSGHTWEEPNAYFQRPGSTTYTGWRPDIASVTVDAACRRPPWPAIIGQGRSG